LIFAVVLLMCLTVVLPLEAANTDDTGELNIDVIVVENGETFADMMHTLRGFTQYTMDPGIAPEGDNLMSSTFTRDGSRILTTNYMTGNVTVYDWSTMNVLANVDVGDFPAGIAVTDSLAIVACPFSDEVYLISLTDYTVDTVFAFSSIRQPWVVRVSHDQTKAYVACDLSNTCEVFDLVARDHIMTISNFPISLLSFSFNSENGRVGATFSNFVVAPSDSHLIVGDRVNSVFFFSTETGTIEHSVSGIPECPSISLSGDGAIAIALSTTDPAVVHQIDIASHTVTSSVTLTDHTISMAYDAAVNQDGSKAFCAIDGNQSALVRFASSDYIILTETYTPFWIGVSPDHTMAISGQYRFSIVDFETETVLGQHIGNSQYVGCVAPVDYRAIGFDPHRHEGIYFYDYTNASAPSYRGTTIAGLEPEGDAPRRVAIAPDGSKAVVTNVLSDNATIIDLDTYTVDTIIPIGDRVQNVAITSDSRWAVICGFNANSVLIIDLDANEIVADVATGSGAGVVSISPNDRFAYVGNIVSNSVSVVELAGAASSEIAEIPCGVIGVVWAAYGVSSDVEASSSNEYALVAVSFEDTVRVIDTLSHTIVASLPVGDFPIQLAFDSTGDYAIVTNYFDDTHTAMHIDGASSSVVGSFTYGDGPLRLAYNRVLDEVGIGYYYDQKVVSVNPRTGAFISSKDYSAYGSVIQVMYDENGVPLVLTPEHLLWGDSVFFLPATPSYFAYCPAVRKTAVVMPGPDYVTVIAWDTLGVKEQVTLPLGTHVLEAPAPNPFSDAVTIAFAIPRQERVACIVYDMSGRRVATLADRTFTPGRHELIWDGNDDSGRAVSAGVFVVRLETDSFRAQEKILHVKP
jgi:YVTN family beta-propeller protein